jgi:hypothetical protein
MKRNVDALAEATKLKRAMIEQGKKDIELDIAVCKYWQSQGYVTIRARVEYGLNDIKDSGVPFALTRKALWVPKWVVDAVNIYTSNGGYAGLTIKDYLTKISAHKGK